MDSVSQRDQARHTRDDQRQHRNNAKRKNYEHDFPYARILICGRDAHHCSPNSPLRSAPLQFAFEERPWTETQERQSV
jgi:hypothetical protein